MSNTAPLRFSICSAFTLKCIMAVLMVMDHLYYFFPERFPFLFTVAGRLVAPVFTFLMTQGLIYTRDRTRYIRRLFLFGLGMQLVNLLLTLRFGVLLMNNIFLSLGLSAAIVTVTEKRPRSAKTIGLLVVLCLATLFVEGAILCPAMALIFYHFREKPGKMLGVYLIAMTAIVLLLTGGLHYYLWMLAAVVPIALYNGKRGPGGPAAKYGFYLFYPVHIWILYGLSILIK